MFTLSDIELGDDDSGVPACRIRDDQSPDNNALLATELLLSGDEVHYLQHVNNVGAIILDCYGSNALYKQVLSLAQMREPFFFDTGTEQIPVLFDYEQKPCIQWKDTRKLSNPPADFSDFFTIYLKAI